MNYQGIEAGSARKRDDTRPATPLEAVEQSIQQTIARAVDIAIGLEGLCDRLYGFRPEPSGGSVASAPAEGSLARLDASVYALNYQIDRIDALKNRLVELA